MRSPQDLTPPRRLSGRPPRRWAIVLGVVLVLGLLVLRNLSVFWTDQMWFSQLGFGRVFGTLFGVKVGLAVTFGAVFFALLWGNLWLTDRFGARGVALEAEDEIVRRFQNVVRPYAGRLYALLAAVTGFIAGTNAIGQWQSWELLTHRVAFHRVDPLFHKDIGFYVFTLPFVRFVLDWTLASLVAVLALTAIFHYLNGGIAFGRTRPRVSPRVKAHLSVIGAAIALVKAAGYVTAKWELVNSTNGYVQGAGYTDVHARMPALTILFFLSLASAAILLANVRSRGWSLPAVAVGLWAFVALVIGVIYPTALQTLKVSPNQDSLEVPYIARNIDATRAAYGVNHATYTSFAGATTVTPAQLRAAASTLANIRLWDPDSRIALATTIRRQSIRSYYTFTTLGVDRYRINGALTPVLIGARQLNTANLPSTNWVNEHLQYTHGIGAAVIAANTVDPATGNPVFVTSNVPPASTSGMPALTQPGVYFGIDDPGWVVANSQQTELDYQVNSGPHAGQPVETHYKGNGGVAVGGVFSRAALALRLGDFNFLISNQITPTSRVIFRRDVMDIARTAAPFLNFDNHPYAVIAGGHLEYVIDGYTTTDQYPYSQNASSFSAPMGGLPGSFNYARNAVKVVVDAYTGATHFYVVDPTDPIIQAWRGAFPSLFTPSSMMPSDVRMHLRYPPNLFATQAAVLGRYHIKNAASFYSASDQWQVSPSSGAGTPNQALAQATVTDAQGNVVSTMNAPMNPLYQVGSLPFANHQQMMVSTAFVPAGKSNGLQNLSAFLIATSDPRDYGKLHVYVTPRGTSVTGPAQADAEIQQNSKVSSLVTLLDQHGSSVLYGNNLMVPLDTSVLYVRPLYVSSSSNPLPQLKDVICVFNQQVGIESTLAGALADVLGSGTGGGGGGGTTSHTAAYYLTEASTDYARAQAALSAGNLGDYQKYVNLMNEAIAAAQKALTKK